MFKLNSLLLVMRLVFLNNGCWHYYLECNSSILPNTVYYPCLDNCPYCKKHYSSYIMPVVRNGLVSFLVNTFFSVSLQLNTIPNMISKLHNFHDISRVVYSKIRMTNPPDIKYIESTIMQLIASGILITIYVVVENRSTLVLHLQHVNQLGTPAYLVDQYWTGFFLL